VSSYELWKLVHVAGLLILFGALGGIAALAQAGAEKAQGKLFGILHGIALAIIVVAGFGLLATFGLHAPGSWPAWVWIKLAVWLAMGAALVVVRRARDKAGLVFLVLVLLGVVAAWSAITKPGM
jgi:hypothetical protein